jgi:hypothetical protein
MADREKVIKATELLDDYFNEYREVYYISPHEAWEIIKDTLKEQKAVEQKIGHWTYLQFCANEGVYCSECHTKMFDRYPMKKKLSQFCGHCGAKMERR